MSVEGPDLYCPAVTYSAAMAKDIVVKDGDKVSVYISHPVPCR